MDPSESGRDEEGQKQNTEGPDGGRGGEGDEEQRAIREIPGLQPVRHQRAEAGAGGQIGGPAPAQGDMPRHGTREVEAAHVAPEGGPHHGGDEGLRLLVRRQQGDQSKEKGSTGDFEFEHRKGEVGLPFPPMSKPGAPREGTGHGWDGWDGWDG